MIAGLRADYDEACQRLGEVLAREAPFELVELAHLAASELRGLREAGWASARHADETLRRHEERARWVAAAEPLARRLGLDGWTDDPGILFAAASHVVFERDQLRSDLGEKRDADHSALADSVVRRDLDQALDLLGAPPALSTSARLGWVVATAQEVR